MNRKYELTREFTYWGGTKLYRIKALRDFGGVRKGDLGGYVESEENLSHDGECWVYDDAMAVEDAYVSGDATIFENAQAFDNAWIYGDAQIFENAQVFENARISGGAWVFGDARVFGDAKVHGNAKVFGDAQAFGNAEISGNARVSGHASIYDICINSSNQYVTVGTTPNFITITYAYVRIGCMHFSLDDLLLEDYRELVAEKYLRGYDIDRTKRIIELHLEGILERMSKEEV